MLHRFQTVIALFLYLLASSALAAEVEGTADASAAAPRAGTDGAAAPGEDPEGGPRTEGEWLRIWTPLTEAELDAYDPQFRGWARAIADGVADKRIMRLYHYYRWRLEPFDRPLPEGWREAGLRVLHDAERSRRAIERFEASRESRGGSDGGTDAGPGIAPRGRWVPFGPYQIAGRTTDLVRPAGATDTIYAATADGGVWRTRDSGATWETLSDFEATLSGGAIALDPTDEDIIYFGTGEGNNAIDNYPGIGVLKSVNGGLTWTESNNFSSIVRRLAIHEAEPNRLYAAGASGCYVSDDAGATFNLINQPGLPTGTSASDVLIRPDDHNVVYCAIWNDAVYRSDDHGDNWTRLDNGWGVDVGRIALAVSESNNDILIAGIDGPSNGEIYKTTDAGDSWVKPAGGNLGHCGGQCWYDNVVGIDPVNPDILYAGGVSAYHSFDGGDSWSTMSSGVHVDHHRLFAPTSGEVFTANDGGIYRSTNHGNSWTEWSLGMDTTQYYGICRAPNDDDWAMGGTQDNGSHRHRTSDGWVQVLGADGGMCMHGPDASGIVLGELQNMNIRRSTNGGDSFSDANGGIPTNDPKPWVGIIVADPTDRNNMWAGTDSAYRSLDARATDWVNVGTNLRCASVIGCRTISAIDVAPSDSNTVYIGFTAFGPNPPFTDGQRGGIVKSTDALDGAPTWTDVTDEVQFPFRSVRRIRVHHDDPNIVYAAFSGYGADKIYKTTDGGTTWVDHTGDLPDIPVNDLAIDPDNPGTIVASTDLGVFRSDDDGTTWYGFSSALPISAAIEMTFNRDTGKLRLGTHGRSMWDWRPASTTAVAVPDGAGAPGQMMTAARTGPADMQVRWDTLGCTGARYNLFYGDLANVSTYTYEGALCDIGTSGLLDTAIPTTPSGDVFFLIASDDANGDEGPHTVDAGGAAQPANGIGFCGITSQTASATCP